MTDDDLATRMMAVHRRLFDLFHEHQVALLDRDTARAVRRLERFRDLLHRHAADEERFVLPVYAARGGSDTDSPPEQFLAEHRKLRTRIAALEEQCRALGDTPDDRAILRLLDAESWFKSLLEHHDVREDRVLYPRYAEWATDAEQAEALANVEA